MDRESISRQLKENIVALVSFVISITTLLYTGWRENSSEKHRNIRSAGFEVLKNLGELQVVVNQAYFAKNDHIVSSPIQGWGYIALISDLSQLLPVPIPQEAQKLTDVWGDQWQKISDDGAAVDQISAQIDKSRELVLHAIKELH